METKIAKGRSYHEAMVSALGALNFKKSGVVYTAGMLASLAENTHVPREARPAVIDALKGVRDKLVKLDAKDGIEAITQVDRAIDSIERQSAHDGNGHDIGGEKGPAASVHADTKLNGRTVGVHT